VLTKSKLIKVEIRKTATLKATSFYTLSFRQTQSIFTVLVGPYLNS